MYASHVLDTRASRRMQGPEELKLRVMKVWRDIESAVLLKSTSVNGDAHDQR
jgi:hypothetical protein